MATTSSYLKYLPPVLWENDPPANLFSLGTMLSAFEKILTGIDDGIVITHGTNAVLSVVTQSVVGSPLSQTVTITPGTGGAFQAGSSYTYNGATPEVINVTAVNANTLTAVFRQNHAKNQTVVDSSGVHQPVRDVIAGLASLFGPWTTPPDFLDWLAQWVALQLDPAWDEYQRRSVISDIVGIYAQRGTKLGLYEFLDIYALSKRRPRLVIDDDSKVLFAKPQAGQIVPVPALVSQTPLVAPQCIALDGNGYLFVGDLGDSDSTIKPALWRIALDGSYDYAAGTGALPAAVAPPPSPQPFQPASLALSAPVAVTADSVNGGAYLIDFTADYVMYRLSEPQIGTVTLTGTPTSGEAPVIAIDGTPYALAPVTGDTLAQAATAAAALLNGTPSFSAGYDAVAVGNTIVLTPFSGVPGNDLTLVVASASLGLSATGPCFGTAVTFAGDASVPPLGLEFPVALAVDAGGEPLVLDRGAVVTNPSATAIVEVQIAGAPPVYTGTARHGFAAIVEPLSMVLLADGSLVVGDAGDQTASTPATLYQIDTTTWTATNLLAAVAPADNPLVAPAGVVEVDAEHLVVLDAGLRPYRPSAGAPFNPIVAQQPAIYSVDLSVAPPAIAIVSDRRSMVYPRGMVGEGDGTLYVCDSGLPDLAGYNALKWRSFPQQFSVVVHFPGNPTTPIFSVTVAGTPTTGESGIVTIGGVAYALAETTGDSLPQQAAAWVTTLNADPSFNALYVAGSLGDVVNIYPVPGTDANGTSFAVTSSASLALSAGLLAATVTLAGVPTAPENVVVNIGGGAYPLPETTGDSLAQQATTWAATLNANATFNRRYIAVGVDNVVSIYYAGGSVADNLPFFVTGSPDVTLTGVQPPFFIGSVTLSGTPTTGENGTMTVGTLPAYALAETTGFTIAQQAEAWCATLNASAPFAAVYSCNSSGGAINIFADGSVSAAGLAISAASSAHLQLATYSEVQNRNQFLQSIRDVVADEIPANARWYLQSEQSQL